MAEQSAAEVERADDPGFDEEAESTPSKPPAAAPPNKHPRGLIRRARALNFSQQDIDEADTDDLDDWVEAETAKLQREKDNAFNARSVREHVQNQPRQPAPVPEEDFSDLTPELDRIAEHQPAIAKVLKHLPETLQENKLLKQKIEAIEKAEVSRRQQAIWDAADEAFDIINEPERYGEGSGTQMANDDPMMWMRNSIINAAGVDVLKDSPSQAKRKIIELHKKKYPKHTAAVEPEEEEVTATYQPSGLAARTSIEKKIAAAVPRQPNGKPRLTADDFRNGTTAQPTQRGHKEPPSRRKAIREVAKSMGVPDTETGDEEDTLRD